MDFQKLISEVAANFEPEYDCAELEDHHLLGIYCVYTIWGSQCVIRILDMKGKAPFTIETDKMASKICRDPNPDNLANLYSINPDPRPLRFLVWLVLARNHITLELGKRHRGLKAGWAFFHMDMQVEPNEVHKAIGVETLTSYSAKEEDTEDLKSEATTKALDFFKHRHGTVEVKQRYGMPIPPLPQNLGLAPQDPDPWGLHHRYLLDWYIDRLAKEYQSLFIGGVDRVKEAVHQYLRNKWETRDRRKTIFEGKEDLPKQGPDSVRADWDFSKTSAKIRGEEITSETLGDISPPEDSLANREIGAQAYDFVLSRWGEQGRIFLDTLIATRGNVTAASEAAGFSRVTGHKLRTELQIFVSKKNPAK